MLQDLFTPVGLSKAVIVLGVLYLLLQRLPKVFTDWFDDWRAAGRAAAVRIEGSKVRVEHVPRDFNFRGPCPGDDGDEPNVTRRWPTRDSASDEGDTKLSVEDVNAKQAPKPKPKPRPRPTPAVSDKSWMPEIVTGVLLAASLFIILRETYSDANQKFAFTTVGTVLGYWLRPPRR